MLRIMIARVMETGIGNNKYALKFRLYNLKQKKNNILNCLQNDQRTPFNVFYSPNRFLAACID
jgi:hypothetical protein